MSDLTCVGHAAERIPGYVDHGTFRFAHGDQDGPEKLCRIPKKNAAGRLHHVPVQRLPAALS